MQDKEIKKAENKKYYNPTYHREYYARRKAGITRELWNSMTQAEKELHLKKGKLKE